MSIQVLEEGEAGKDKLRMRGPYRSPTVWTLLGGGSTEITALRGLSKAFPTASFLTLPDSLPMVETRKTVVPSYNGLSDSDSDPYGHKESSIRSRWEGARYYYIPAVYEIMETIDDFENRVLAGMP
ncbi:hypothetical protein FRB96_003080 [Tulasnella sp. 330]|nr:hypothetical protein FRB96_003080 [Tulasnella sp. 330]